jgi:TonB family protein
MLKSEFEYHPILERSRNLRRQAFSISISFLVHLVIFLCLFLLYEPLQVHIYQEVRNVIIASPSDIVFPEYRPPPEAVASTSQEAAAAAGRPRASESSAGRVEIKDKAAPTQDRDPTGSVDSPRFQLQPSGSEKLRLSSGYELELSLKPGEEDPFTSRMTEPPAGSRADISGFVNPDLAGGKLPSYSGARGPGGRSWLQAQMDQLQQDYDLSPWADQVVGTVLANWTVPPSGQYTLNGRVEISVTIHRDGRLSGSEILVSSQNSLIDRTALKALESSSLPGLPEEYPRDEVRIKLVFALQ